MVPSLHIYCRLILSKAAKHALEKRQSFQRQCWENWISTQEELNLVGISHHSQKSTKNGWKPRIEDP